MLKFLDVDGWRDHATRTGEHLHVYLDGEDVTLRVFRVVPLADGVRAEVWMYVLNAEGHKYLDSETGAVATESRIGPVDIRPGQPFFAGRPAA